MRHMRNSEVMSDQKFSLSLAYEYSQEECERLTHDRRKASIMAVWHSLVSGRRTITRRDISHQSEHIIDTHENWLLIFMLGILTLSILDACFTLILLEHGATEANPFMDILIKHDVGLFFIVKFAITAIGLFFLIILKKFTLFKCLSGYHLLLLLLTGYTCLVGFEIYKLEAIFI